MEGPDLIRRFLLGLRTGEGMAWEEEELLWKGIITTATGIESSLDWSVWRSDRIHEWTSDKRLSRLLVQEGEEGDRRDGESTDVKGRFATCSIPACLRPGVRGASCATCKRHFCAVHLSKQYHTCRSSYEVCTLYP